MQSLKDHMEGAPESSAAEISNLAPSKEALYLWRSAKAVCLNADCVTVDDTVDLLGKHMGLEGQLLDLTKQVSDGRLSAEAALDERQRLVSCSPAVIEDFLDMNPPEARLAPGVKELVDGLLKRQVSVLLLSEDFRELVTPLATLLGLPPENVFANALHNKGQEGSCPQREDSLGERASRVAEKRAVIRHLRQLYPYNVVAMIGDGITDLQAADGGADLFIGYGGVAVRPQVVQGAAWFVRDFSRLSSHLKRPQVAFVGSGAWASAAAKLAASNAAGNDMFQSTVKMWVYPEEVDGKRLDEIVNEKHENVKYLPGIKLPENLVASADLKEVVKDATAIVICTPHQFVFRICQQLRDIVEPSAVAISLTKGMRVQPEGPQLISELVRKTVGIDCSVLMGANIAEEIAKGQLSEATIGYSVLEHGRLFQQLFETENFYTTLVPDVAGAEMAGTLKNIVALGAGFVDGLGAGSNTKATIIRAGLAEMRQLSKDIYPTVRDETFLESCGVADLVATCYGGRNRRIAEAWTKAQLEGKPRSWDELEAELLGGQKLQGVLTSNEVQSVLRARGWEARFPLFTTINRIVDGELNPSDILRFRKAVKPATSGK